MATRIARQVPAIHEPGPTTHGDAGNDVIGGGADGDLIEAGDVVNAYNDGAPEPGADSGAVISKCSLVSNDSS